MNWQLLDEDSRPVLGALNDWLDGFGLEGIHGADIVYAVEDGIAGSLVHYFSWAPANCETHRHKVAVTWHVGCEHHQHVIEDVTLTKERK